MTIKNLDNIIIVHGFLARPENHWFPWLKTSYEEKGCQVIIPDISSVDMYVNCLGRIKKRINNNTWIVAHSIGCAAAIELLSTIDDFDLPKGIIMVSGFIEPLPVWHEDKSLEILNKFINNKVDLNKILKIKNRFVISSSDDHYVPSELSFKLSKIIDSCYIELRDYGHFTGDDGVYELNVIPLIIDGKLR